MITLIRQARNAANDMLVLDEISIVFVTINYWIPNRNRKKHLPTIKMKRGTLLVAIYFAVLNVVVCVHGELMK